MDNFQNLKNVVHQPREQEAFSCRWRNQFRHGKLSSLQSLSKILDFDAVEPRTPAGSKCKKKVLETQGLMPKTFGSAGRARTADPVINSHLLYLLSYCGIGRSIGNTSERYLSSMAERKNYLGNELMNSLTLISVFVLASSSRSKSTSPFTVKTRTSLPATFTVALS